MFALLFQSLVTWLQELFVSQSPFESWGDEKYEKLFLSLSYQAPLIHCIADLSVLIDGHPHFIMVSLDKVCVLSEYTSMLTADASTKICSNFGVICTFYLSCRHLL